MHGGEAAAPRPAPQGRGFSQEALAGVLDVERSTVVRWESGETEPLPWIRPKLARALGVSADQLDELLGRAGPAAPRHPEADPGPGQGQGLGQGLGQGW